MTNLVRIVVNITDLVRLVQDHGTIQPRFNTELFIDWVTKNAYLDDINTFQWVIIMDSVEGYLPEEDEWLFALPSGYRFGDSSYLELPGFRGEDVRRKLDDFLTTAGFSDICFLIKTHKRDDTIARLFSKPLTEEGVEHILYFDWPDHRDEDDRRLLEIPGKTEDIRVYHPGFLVRPFEEPTSVPAEVSLYVDVDETLLFTQFNLWHQEPRIEYVRQTLDALARDRYPHNVLDAIDSLNAILSNRMLWTNTSTLPLLTKVIETLENARSECAAPSDHDVLIHCLQTLQARVWNHGLVHSIARWYIFPDTPTYLNILTSRALKENMETHPLMPTAAAHIIETAHKALEPHVIGDGPNSIFLNGFDHFCRNPKDVPRLSKDHVIGDHIMLKLGYVIAAQILAYREDPAPDGLRHVYVIDDQIAQIYPFFTDDINEYLSSNGYPIEYIPIFCTTKLALEEPINRTEHLLTAETLRHEYFCKHCEPLSLVDYMLQIYPTIKARDITADFETHVQSTYQLACKLTSLARWLEYTGPDTKTFPEAFLEEPLISFTKRAYESPVIKKTPDFRADFRRSIQHAVEVIHQQMTTPIGLMYGEYAPHTLFFQRSVPKAKPPARDYATEGLYTISLHKQ